MASKKTYVIDTNIFLTDSDAIFKFGTGDIVLPLKILEEIDNHKKKQDGVGLNARSFIRILDDLRKKGNLNKGVRIDKGLGIVRAGTSDLSLLPPDFDKTLPDNIILACALQEKQNPDKRVIVVSLDINLRVRCDALGLECESYTENQVVKRSNEIFTGCSKLSIDDQLIDRFYSGESLFLESDERTKDFKPNQFIILVSLSNEKKTAMARFVAFNKPLARVREYVKGREGTVFGLTARNKEQQMALNLLMDDSIPVVTLMGSAGSGKTLLSIAAALELVINREGTDGQKYEKIIISRPIMPMGKDIGYLPGPQPLDAKILTPSGWTTMGQIKIGDEVIARDGTPAKVLKIIPHGIKNVVKVTTSENKSTECCEDHIWTTTTREEKKRNKNGRIRSTKEIRDTLLNKHGKFNHHLPRNNAVEFIKNNTIIPPYVLGCILGDGSISHNISIANTDPELIERIGKELIVNNCEFNNQKGTISYNISRNLYNNKPARKVRLTNLITGEVNEWDSIGKALLDNKNINRSTFGSRCQEERVIDNIKYEFISCSVKWQNPIKNELDKLGLSGTKAWTKFIPDIYKFSSIEDRVALLQGLMDTDGTIKKNGEASFTTTSSQLAADMIELVNSLGGRSVMHNRDRIGKITNINGRQATVRRISYEFNISLPNGINPFYISRKANRHVCNYMHGHLVTNIEDIGQKEVQCIVIDNDEHLYITDGYIVTHNSIDEKLSPWLMPIQDNMDTLFSGKENKKRDPLAHYKDSGVIQVEALTYIRGRSLNNAFIIIDECQNMTKHEIKTILTRVGENTKIVLTGDVEQIDNTYLNETTNGLTYAIEKLKDSELTSHITLIRGERSKVASAAARLL